MAVTIYEQPSKALIPRFTKGLSYVAEQQGGARVIGYYQLARTPSPATSFLWTELWDRLLRPSQVERTPLWKGQTGKNVRHLERLMC